MSIGDDTYARRCQLAIAKGARSVRVANPLSTIALFLAFSEITSGIAATLTAGAIQVAFTAFSILFPILVVIGFVFVLWKKPEVLYAPGDFSEETPIKAYVEAIRGAGIQESVEAQNDALQEIVVSAVESVIARYRSSPTEMSAKSDFGDIARLVAQQEIRKRTIEVDLSSVAGGVHRLAVPVADSTSVDAFLNSVFFALKGAVRPFTYGIEWTLADPSTGRQMRSIGTIYAKERLGTARDNRLLGQVGIEPGSPLEVQLLNPS